MLRGLSFLLCLLAVACGPREINVTMTADNNSGQSGTAVLTERGAGMLVVIETVAPLFDGGQNVHIHPGTCGELDKPRVDLTRMAPLEKKPGYWGSTTFIDGGFGFKDLATGDWAINIHDSREASVYVSCGEIPKP